ncbi:hypothetical protein R1flu_012336 [Riccia fluitans]|uniref:DUF4283 domain-containing protein n=1 Tax=Riccia fluitans TaxID=41844 RepID=A0ABD1ZCT1_9MARC
MERIRYSTPRPWPDNFSLVEAVEIKKAEFSPTKVTQHVGRVGSIPRTWKKQKQDWYLEILEFVCIRTVQRQKEKVVGPFRFVLGIDDFVLLEDFKKIQFWFPKFLRQDKEKETLFSTTAIWIWTFGCYCKALEGRNEIYPPGCFCLEIFNRGLCLQCTYRPDLHTRRAVELVGDSQRIELDANNEEHEGACPGNDEKEVLGAAGDGKNDPDEAVGREENKQDAKRRRTKSSKEAETSARENL